MTETAQKNMRNRIVREALALAAARGWDTLSLSDIAKACDLSLAGLHDYIEDKTDILAALGRMIDHKVLENTVPAAEGVSPRDRLFDILMERYEALNEYRDGIAAILRSFRPDPKQAVISMPHLCRSMAWMLEAAGIDTNGLGGAVRVAGLSIIYIKGLKTWVDDNSPDLSKTMALLDRDLGRAEKFANAVGF